MFSMYTTLFSMNDNFDSFFLLLIPFIYFSCLIALARTFNTLLKGVLIRTIFILFLISKRKFSD